MKTTMEHIVHLEVTVTTFDGQPKRDLATVSYTHLTLPTRIRV